jgi:hypothetical protein
MNNTRPAFKSPGVVVALSIAVLILILGLFFGFGGILSIWRFAIGDSGRRFGVCLFCREKQQNSQVSDIANLRAPYRRRHKIDSRQVLDGDIWTHHF